MEQETKEMLEKVARHCENMIFSDEKIAEYSSTEVIACIKGSNRAYQEVTDFIKFLVESYNIQSED